MSCPFLTRLPTTFVKNYGSVLAKQYLDHCPFLGSYVQHRNIGTNSTKENQLQCPFLKNTKDSEEAGIIKSVLHHQEDIATAQSKYQFEMMKICNRINYAFSLPPRRRWVSVRWLLQGSNSEKENGSFLPDLQKSQSRCRTLSFCAWIQLGRTGYSSLVQQWLSWNECSSQGQRCRQVRQNRQN